MRVITGSARGRKLKELTGMDTRPTTDRVKEAIFSIIQFDLEGRRVLDLFAGTGQLGIEALSRGAASAVFVEHRREAANLIRDNLALTGLAGSARVVDGDAFAFLSSARETFDIILLDPPFAAGLWENALDAISRFDTLSLHDALPILIICESPVQQELPVLSPPYFPHRVYRYGQVKVTTYHKEVGA